MPLSFVGRGQGEMLAAILRSRVKAVKRVVSLLGELWARS